VLLYGLISEIRLRTTHIPLASYPAALTEVARLLDYGKASEASALLMTALNTLVIIDRATPLPLALAQEAINEAAMRGAKEKDAALRFLSVARNELERAKLLGYAGKDSEYESMNKSISDIEKQLNGNQDTASAFAKLKEKVTAFFKKESESQKKSDGPKT
jgi:YfdX protein